MSNRIQYGFRWSTHANGGAVPPMFRAFVATAQSFDVNGGASNVGLGPGDPIRRLNTGGVTLCDGAEGAGGALAPLGIVVGVAPYWSASEGVMRYGEVLPSDTAWGTNLDRQSLIYYTPFTAGVWEIDADDNTTATTKAAYQAFVGENADFRLTGTTDNGRAHPLLDISTHTTTATLICRIVGLADTENNRDFSAARVKLLVTANVAQHPAYNATGV